MRVCMCMCLCTHTCTLTVLTRNRMLNLPALGTPQAHGRHQQSCGEWIPGRKHAKLQWLVMIDIGPWFLSPGRSFSPPSLPTLNVPEAALSNQLIFSLWFFAWLPVTPVHVLMPWNRSSHMRYAKRFPVAEVSHEILEMRVLVEKMFHVEE